MENKQSTSTSMAVWSGPDSAGRFPQSYEYKIIPAVSAPTNTGGVITTNSEYYVYIKMDNGYPFKPVKIIYHPPYTICYFPDGEKTVVKAREGELFDKEVGVLECIVKKIFKNRHDFLKLIDAGFYYEGHHK